MTVSSWALSRTGRSPGYHERMGNLLAVCPVPHDLLGVSPAPQVDYTLAFLAAFLMGYYLRGILGTRRDR